MILPGIVPGVALKSGPGNPNLWLLQLSGDFRRDPLSLSRHFVDDVRAAPAGGQGQWYASHGASAERDYARHAASLERRRVHSLSGRLDDRLGAAARTRSGS